MTGYTLATGRAATLIKLAFAAGAKLSAAFIAFGLTALATRNMPNGEAGLFLLGFSILAVLSIFFRLDLDNVIIRFLRAHGIDAICPWIPQSKPDLDRYRLRKSLGRKTVLSSDNTVNIMLCNEQRVRRIKGYMVRKYSAI